MQGLNLCLLVSALAGIATFLPAPASADLFELGRSSFSGGGGESAGGAFSARSTTSQADAGSASGGDFSMTGSIAQGDPTLCAAMAPASGLIATESSCSGVGLLWIDNSTGETGFRILRNSVLLTTTAADATSHVDATAVSGASYNYTVVASNGCFESDASNIDVGRRPFAPVAPSALVIADYQVGPSGVTVDLVWQDESADEMQQTIYRTTPSVTAIQTLGPGFESASVTVPLPADEPLCFKVGASNCGLESLSEPVCIASLDVSDGGSPLPLPSAFSLHEIRPNPSRSEVTFTCDLPRPAVISVRVFDLGGRWVRTVAEGETPAGRLSLHWDGFDSQRAMVPNGVYFVELRAPGVRQIRRLTRMR